MLRMPRRVVHESHHCRDSIAALEILLSRKVKTSYIFTDIKLIFGLIRNSAERESCFYDYIPIELNISDLYVPEAHSSEKHGICPEIGLLSEAKIIEKSSGLQRQDSGGKTFITRDI